ncbi:uncharacterized protein [Prorops nasuta]|uniref:uncharacterized protein n=1 Tax=Prorops nasuta TaxID=863751 RepID=UPI0034CDD66A
MASKEKSSNRKAKKFQLQWYDDYPSWKIWVKRVPNDDYKYFCVACNKSYACGRSQLLRHSESLNHLMKMKEIDTAEDEDLTNPSTSRDEQLDFSDKVKVAEIKLATFFVEHNIPFVYRAELLTIFKEFVKEPDVLQSISLGRTKLKNIINNVLCPYETKRITNKLKNNKFSVFEDESSDITNEKKITLLTRYVDNRSLRVHTELLQLINLDASDCSAQKIFNSFSSELIKKEIPLAQIIGLSCDNASVMVGKHDSFQTRLVQKCPRLVTMPCICHSSALVAANACKTLATECGNFIKKVVSFISGSPKRTAIFKDFQQAFTNENKILIKKISQAEELLRTMENSETIAYLLFLNNIMKKFNSFNAFFQASETKIYLVQQHSLQFLTFFLQKFLRPPLLKEELVPQNLKNLNFSEIENQLPLESVDIGLECADYLENQLIEEKLDEREVQLIRQNCLSFLVKAKEEIRDRFPIFDRFLENLNIFKAEEALFIKDREASTWKLLEICRRLGNFDKELIKNEWTSLYSTESSEVKQYWSKLPFDNMWMAICSKLTERKEIKYPQLRLLLNIVRSLPHSNAEAERCFSIIPDNKNKKRNKLSPETVNAICVIKYALRSKNETSLSITVTEQHLHLMKTQLNVRHSVTAGSSLNVYSCDDSDDNDIDLE